MICNHYLDKREDVMKNTQFKIKDISGDIRSKGSNFPEQKNLTELFKQKYCEYNH